VSVRQLIFYVSNIMRILFLEFEIVPRDGHRNELHINYFIVAYSKHLVVCIHTITLT